MTLSANAKEIMRVCATLALAIVSVKGESEAEEVAIDIKNPASATTVVHNAKPESRSLTIKNSCSFDINLGSTGGFAGVTEHHCPLYQANDGNNRCFWDMDLPETIEAGDYVLANLQHEHGDVIYSGQIWGTRFIEDACPGGKCRPWVGPRGVVTRAEFTFLVGEQMRDYYDISIIDGANIPVSMSPTQFEDTHPDDYFICGQASVVSQECKWDFDPGDDGMYLAHVKNTNEACKSNDECSHGDVCGFSTEDGPVSYGLCGKHVGWAGGHANCVAGNAAYPFYCSEFHDLFGCSGQYSRSGYNTPEGKVCGCSDYKDLGLPTHFECVNTDKKWEEHVLKWVLFLKSGCGNAYAYAYDDASSLFSCTSQAYTIEFCPGDTESVFFV